MRPEDTQIVKDIFKLLDEGDREFLVVVPTHNYGEWMLREIWDKTEGTIRTSGGTLQFPDEGFVQYVVADKLGMCGRSVDRVLIHPYVYEMLEPLAMERIRNALLPCERIHA